MRSFPPSTLEGLMLPVRGLMRNASLVVCTMLASVAHPVSEFSVVVVLALIPKDINSLRGMSFLRQCARAFVQILRAV